MNAWLVATTILLIGVLPNLVVVLRGRVLERFVAVQMTQVLVVNAMVLMAEGYQRDIYFDMALVLAALSLASALVFVRFLERWL